MRVLEVVCVTGPWLPARVGDMGRMALSNYLLTSLTIKPMFVWGFRHWDGYVE